MSRSIASVFCLNRYILSLLSLGGWLFLSFAAAAMGGVATATAPEFYRELQQPSWAPPASVFGPVWTILYTLQGIAAWLIWRERNRTALQRLALGLFLAQLALNALWSWIFFNWQLGWLSLLEIVVLWALIVATINAFFRVRVLAGTLMLPYLAWVTFAAVLTAALWRLNPEILG